MRLRLRLTVLYGGVFALVTTVILLIVQQQQLGGVNDGLRVIQRQPVPGDVVAAQQDIDGTGRLLGTTTVVVITIAAFLVCWWLCGRLLRPLQRVNGAARRFVANASHELRTPLAVQRAAIEVGLADPTPERVALVRAELLRTTERSERLLDGLLALAQSEQGPQADEPVDLAALVTETAGENRPAAAAAGVDLTVATRPVTVTGDEVMLGQLLTNLLQNACRYNRRGGSVTVELSADAVLTVRNTGPDVPPELVGEIFEPFRRLPAARSGPVEGAGLGLSIVAAIVRAHRGTVGAVANAGGGLTVTVALRGSRVPRSG